MARSSKKSAKNRKRLSKKAMKKTRGGFFDVFAKAKPKSSSIVFDGSNT